MRIKTNFIIICDQAFLTAGTNKLNMIGVFSQINSEKFPVQYPHFALVANFDIDTSGQHTIRTAVIDSVGTIIAQTQIPIPASSSPLQIIANFENLTFAGPGNYEIKLSIDDMPAGSQIIRVAPVVKQKANFA